MDVAAGIANGTDVLTDTCVSADTCDAIRADTAANPDFGFLPKSLTVQCQRLIESYHDLHGYACLPDILWKSRLGPFIETHHELQQLLRKASTTRSAKKANQGFARIATTILSLEILASSFAGWSAIYPEAGSKAHAILRRNSRSPQMPLMEFYLYPPKYLSTAAIATLIPPSGRQDGEAELSRAPEPDPASGNSTLHYANTIQQTFDGAPAPSARASAI
jgi:hypothetical protein